MRSSQLIFFLLLLAAAGLSAQEPSRDELHRTLAALDEQLFDAYNRCDMEAFRSHLLDGDVEFFHEGAGLTDSADDLVEAIQQHICGKAQRRLAEGSLETYPIPGYGAIQIGAHRFYAVGESGPAADAKPAKFLHIWKNVDGEWKLARAVSYDH